MDKSFLFAKDAIFRDMTHGKGRKYVQYALSIIASLLMIVLGSCSMSGGDAATTGNQLMPHVNGFGVASNHPHSLLVLPNNVLLLATHYGLFRSKDEGASWKEVAGGSGQIMEGLMTYSLTSSPLDNQRLYVLTQQVTSVLKGKPGLYSSSDQGQSWKLVNTTAVLGNMFMVTAGNDTSKEVYICQSSLGALGLKVSRDGGQHFTSTGTLPFSNVTQLLAIPGAPGHLLIGSIDGLARSTDGGAHWKILKEMSGAVLSITTVGPGGVIYASGDAGIYVSHNGGASFEMIYNKSSLGEIVITPGKPQTLYTRTGTAIYHSVDGGRTWKSIPRVKGNMYSLVADPTNASRVYLSLSYPAEVYCFNQISQSWTSLTPGS